MMMLCLDTFPACKQELKPLTIAIAILVMVQIPATYGGKFLTPADFAKALNEKVTETKNKLAADQKKPELLVGDDSAAASMKLTSFHFDPDETLFGGPKVLATIKGKCTGSPCPIPTIGNNDRIVIVKIRFACKLTATEQKATFETLQLLDSKEETIKNAASAEKLAFANAIQPKIEALVQQTLSG